MRVVLDTSSLIYLTDFRNFEEMFTVNSVIEEVKDRMTKMKLSALEIKVVEPKKEIIEEIKKIAIETSDLKKLSSTDIEVLALAKEKNCTIISDDRNIQNVAEKIGIGYVSIFSEKIKKLITWGNYCKNCKKYFEKEKECPICGEKLIRFPRSSIDIVKPTPNIFLKSEYTKS
ncbi:MAG: PIN domain-containing protein [Candidatus Aenigmatarchaeota archaeon]